MGMMHIHGEVHPFDKLLPIGRVQRDYQDVPISMDMVFIHGWHGPISRMEHLQVSDERTNLTNTK